MKSILIAEDNIVLGNIYKETFEGIYNVVVVADGSKALEEVKNKSFDLLLIDIMMPILDGVTFLTNLMTQRGLPPHGPIYMLTNLKDDELINKCTKLGAAGYIFKSDYDPGQLLKKVSEILKN